MWEGHGGCDRRTKCSQKELPHVRGQGQKPGGPHAQRAVAKRSYPTSEVRAAAESARLRRRRNGREELPDVGGPGRRGGGGEGSRPRGATQRPRSGGAAERRHPASEVSGSGWEEIPHALKPEARGGGREDQPHAVAALAQEGLEELSHVEGQEGRR